MLHLQKNEGASIADSFARYVHGVCDPICTEMKRNPCTKRAIAQMILSSNATAPP